MIIAVKTLVNTGAISMPPKGSRFWILAKELTHLEPIIPREDIVYTVCAPHDFLVPEGVTLVQATVAGAGYGGSGFGGMIQVLIPTIPGETLRTWLGGQPDFAGGGFYVGGCHGGGFGVPTVRDGYGGSGFSEIRRAPYDRASTLVVAGGGGGIGDVQAATAGGTPAPGGHGGWPTGTDGTGSSHPFNPYGQGGLTGTQTTDGAGGVMYIFPTNQQGGDGYIDATAADIGHGGNGYGVTTHFDIGGGGGGGGWHGGGGGGQGAGGGGGSSYFNPAHGVIMVANQTGANNGFGYIQLAY